MSDPRQFRSGLVFGLVAYTWWGLVPIYFKQLSGIDAGEILAHRVVWGLAVLLAVCAIRGTLPELLRVLRSRRLMAWLALSTTLLSVNWLLFIHAMVANHVLDASLGYYILPLVNAALATLVLGEKLRPAHYPALALVALAVVVPTVALGLVPWIPITLAVSFGLYGLVRKMIPVDSLTGLTVETIWLLPFAVVYFYYLHMTGSVMFGQDSVMATLLVLSGIITVVPLLTFALAIRRLPLLALNLIQVLSPTLQFLVAVGWNEQEVPGPMWVALGCVLLAVALFIGDAVWQASQGKPPLEAGPADPTLADEELAPVPVQS